MSDAAASVLSGSLAGLDITPDELRFLKRESPAGLTVFGRNIDQENHQNLKELISRVQSCTQVGVPPMLISIDQEGGRVARLKGAFPNMGPAMNLAGGKSDQVATDEIRKCGEVLGRSLLDLGVNCNFAPVVDVLTRDENVAIGDRAFGRDPASVVIRAGAFLVGMNSTGILTCLKHFPGQGDAGVDTHLGTATVAVAKDLLTKREIFPFRSLMKNAPMIMVSHCIYPALDTVEASLSAKVMKGLLRGSMGYTGVIVSDDMMMGALPSDIGAWRQAMIDSIAAGADLLLVCKDLSRWQVALDALRGEASKSRAFDRRLSEAAGRVTRLRQKIGNSQRGSAV
jgi:beta-N-acetylhexosaminidase